MRYVIEHEVHLHFADPVYEHQCEVRLVPVTTATQRVVSAAVTTDPESRPITYTDAFGNLVHHFDVADPHDDLITRTQVDVETLLANPFDYPPIVPERERVWIAEALRAQPRLWDFVLHRSALTPALDTLGDAAKEFPAAPTEGHVIQAVIAARDWISDSFKYVRDYEKALATPSELLTTREGSARDLAHLLITIVRSWGVPARYVSGYQDCSEEEDEDEREPRPHAWTEVLIPGAGWRGLDATARLVTSDTYVSVAVGRDARDTVAQRCSFKGDGESETPQIVVRLQRQQ